VRQDPDEGDAGNVRKVRIRIYDAAQQTRFDPPA